MTDEITLDAPETRLERFLAAAAGVDGITLDEPETRIERYLYTLAQNVGAAEYWIPVVLHPGSYYFSIPDTMQEEIESKLNDPIHNLIRGISIFDGPTFVVNLPGYVSANEFISPVSKSVMIELGYDSAGRFRITKEAGKYRVRVEEDKFVVTLTPTAQDYSGTMDKTVEIIMEAYEAGQEIWFKVGTELDGYAYIPVSQVSLGDMVYPSFEATLLHPDVGLIYAYTQFTDDDGKMTYATKIYPLTPAT